VSSSVTIIEPKRQPHTV